MKDTFAGLAAVFTIVLIAGSLNLGAAQDVKSPPRGVLVIHGGAGSIARENMSPESEAAYREKLKEALQAGYRALQTGQSSLDAVVAAITIMEDSPLFNSGRGAVLTSEGIVELDASIMEGSTLKAGAVASVKHVKNPIIVARGVMEKSPHVLLVGDGADAFARHIGAETVPNEYFRTDRRLEQYERYKKREKNTGEAGKRLGEWESRKYGTVGAAALDRHGNLAAGTSTGGTSYKKWGRVGDSPIIGAGTYADNATCAISATGTGEYFIRGTLAFRISALMQYAGLSLSESAASVIHGTLTSMGGDGGVVGIDRDGNVSMTFNTVGMFRGYVDNAGNVHVAMYGDE